MNGREVFRFATRVMDEATRKVVADAGLTLKDIDLFIPHQANLRIIQAAVRALKMPMDKFFVNLDRYGNTSAASIPIALCEAVDAGRLNPGDHLVMVGFGAGLTWAASVIQWGVPKPPVPAWRRTLDGLRRVAAGKLCSRARRLQRRLGAVLFGSPEPRTIDEGRVGLARDSGQNATWPQHLGRWAMGRRSLNRWRVPTCSSRRPRQSEKGSAHGSQTMRRLFASRRPSWSLHTSYTRPANQRSQSLNTTSLFVSLNISW
jgi:hypothetical protein